MLFDVATHIHSEPIVNSERLFLTFNSLTEKEAVEYKKMLNFKNANFKIF